MGEDARLHRWGGVLVVLGCWDCVGEVFCLSGGGVGRWLRKGKGEDKGDRKGERV